MMLLMPFSCLVMYVLALEANYININNNICILSTVSGKTVAQVF